MKVKVKIKIAAFIITTVFTVGTTVMPTMAYSIKPPAYAVEKELLLNSLTRKERVTLSSVTQKEALSADYTNDWLKKEKSKFPAGKYWNGGNTNSYTNSGCDHKNDKYKCNKFSVQNIFKPNYWGEVPNYGLQCHGFALRLAYDYFGGCDIFVKQKYTSGFHFRVGDIIRINGDSHSVFVTGVDGNSLTYSDCNNGETCIIRWDVSASIKNDKLCRGNAYQYSINYILRPAMSGDIDGDSQITSKDLEALRKILDKKFDYIPSVPNYNTVIKEAADVNNDARITEDDYKILQSSIKYGYIKTGRFLTDLGIWIWSK